MTNIEKNSILKLCAFSFLSLCAGFWYLLGDGWIHFTARQASEIVLLIMLYHIFRHYNHKKAKIFSGALVWLSFAEMVDEFRRNNEETHSSDYLLFTIAAAVVFILLRNGRNKK